MSQEKKEEKKSEFRAFATRAKNIYDIIPCWLKAGRDLRVMIIGKVVNLTPDQVWSDHTTFPYVDIPYGRAHLVKLSG